MATALECDNCGASLRRDAVHCVYCGSSVVPRAASQIGRPANDKDQFGFSGWLYHLSTLGAIAALYALGWLLEDTRYWLNTRAFIVWTGAIPAVMFLFALLRRSEVVPILLGLGISLALTVSHCVVMVLIRGNLNDDMLGIAAIIGGSAMLGWIAGGLVRHRICKGLSRRTAHQTG